MKCPNCSSELNERNECDLCGYKKRSAQGFLNYRVYLVSAAVIIVGLLAYRFMPSFTTASNQSSNAQEVTISNQAKIQPQLAVAYGAMVAYDGSNCFTYSGGGLYRNSPDFQGGELLSNQLVNYLLVDENHIYYCDEYYDFYRVDKEFRNTPEKLLTNIYYPILDDDYLYYQDDGDNESIYRLNLESLETEKLNDEPSYALMIVDGSIYYLDDEAAVKMIDGQGNIETLVAGEVTSFLVCEGKVYYTATSGLWQYDIDVNQATLLYANEYGDVLPFLMLNVYQNKLVFVSYQGIVLYDLGQIEIISNQIDFTKFIVVNDHIVTIDDELNYNLIDESQSLEGSMEV